MNTFNFKISRELKQSFSHHAGWRKIPLKISITDNLEISFSIYPLAKKNKNPRDIFPGLNKKSGQKNIPFKMNILFSKHYKIVTLFHYKTLDQNLRASRFTFTKLKILLF
tara:strand:- start:1009 stop:1338 length:330 start_codon:yes stop_codon:yes gene_type:complete